jgi:single-stranded DNA-binding protein
MSASAFIKGVLYKAPERRTSKTGNPFTMATVRVAAGEAAQFWRTFAFGDHARAELDRLHDGDHVAIQGLMTASIYQGKNGPAVSLSIVADHVLAGRQPPRERNTKQKPSPATSRGDAPPASNRGGDIDDDIPF